MKSNIVLLKILASFAVFIFAMGLIESSFRAAIVGVAIFAFSVWKIISYQKELKRLEEKRKNLGERLFRKSQQLNKGKE